MLLDFYVIIVTNYVEPIKTASNVIFVKAGFTEADLMSLGNTNLPYLYSKCYIDIFPFHNLSNYELRMTSPSNGNLQPAILIDDNKKNNILH